MELLISSAYAQNTPPPAGGGMGSIIMIVLFVAIFWLFLLRPQQKRLREHQNMIGALSVGDEVVTAGGVYGTVRKLTERTAVVEVADGVNLKIQKPTITNVVPKGSVEAAD